MMDTEKREMREVARKRLALMRGQLAVETNPARRGHLEWMIAELEEKLKELR